LGDVGAFGAVLGALSKLEPVISSLCLATHHRHTLAKQQKLPVHPGHAFEMKQKLAAHQGRTSEKQRNYPWLVFTAILSHVYKIMKEADPKACLFVICFDSSPKESLLCFPV